MGLARGLRAQVLRCQLIARMRAERRRWLRAANCRVTMSLARNHDSPSRGRRVLISVPSTSWQDRRVTPGAMVGRS